jgi:hypothetical protein
MTKTAKHLHLLPILSFAPLLIALLAVTQIENVVLDSLTIAVVALTYLAVNVIYRLLHGSLEVYLIIEYSLIALLAFFVLNEYA